MDAHRYNSESYHPIELLVLQSWIHIFTGFILRNKRSLCTTLHLTKCPLAVAKRSINLGPDKQVARSPNDVSVARFVAIWMEVVMNMTFSDLWTPMGKETIGICPLNNATTVEKIAWII